MSEFKVTASELLSKAEELEQFNNQFKDKVNDLEGYETTLVGMWEGEAKESFHKAFNNDKIQMSNFFNAIAQYVAALRTIAERYSTAESKNNATANDRTYH